MEKYDINLINFKNIYLNKYLSDISNNNYTTRKNSFYETLFKDYANRNNLFETSKDNEICKIILGKNKDNTSFCNIAGNIEAKVSFPNEIEKFVPNYIGFLTKENYINLNNGDMLINSMLNFISPYEGTKSNFICKLPNFITDANKDFRNIIIDIHKNNDITRLINNDYNKNIDNINKEIDDYYNTNDYISENTVSKYKLFSNINFRINRLIDYIIDKDLNNIDDMFINLWMSIFGEYKNNKFKLYDYSIYTSMALNVLSYFNKNNIDFNNITAGKYIIPFNLNINEYKTWNDVEKLYDNNTKLNMLNSRTNINTINNIDIYNFPKTINENIITELNPLNITTPLYSIECLNDVIEKNSTSDITNTNLIDYYCKYTNLEKIVYDYNYNEKFSYNEFYHKCYDVENYSEYNNIGNIDKLIQNNDKYWKKENELKIIFDNVDNIESLTVFNKPTMTSDKYKHFGCSSGRKNVSVPTTKYTLTNVHRLDVDYVDNIVNYILKYTDTELSIPIITKVEIIYGIPVKNTIDSKNPNIVTYDLLEERLNKYNFTQYDEMKKVLLEYKNEVKKYENRIFIFDDNELTKINSPKKNVSNILDYYGYRIETHAYRNACKADVYYGTWNDDTINFNPGNYRQRNNQDGSWNVWYFESIGYRDFAGRNTVPVIYQTNNITTNRRLGNNDKGNYKQKNILQYENYEFNDYRFADIFQKPIIGINIYILNEDKQFNSNIFNTKAVFSEKTFSLKYKSLHLESVITINAKKINYNGKDIEIKPKMIKFLNNDKGYNYNIWKYDSKDKNVFYYKKHPFLASLFKINKSTSVINQKTISDITQKLLECSNDALIDIKNKLLSKSKSKVAFIHRTYKYYANWFNKKSSWKNNQNISMINIPLLPLSIKMSNNIISENGTIQTPVKIVQNNEISLTNTFLYKNNTQTIINAMYLPFNDKYSGISTMNESFINNTFQLNPLIGMLLAIPSQATSYYSFINGGAIVVSDKEFTYIDSKTKETQSLITNNILPIQEICYSNENCEENSETEKINWAKFLNNDAFKKLPFIGYIKNTRLNQSPKLKGLVLDIVEGIELMSPMFDYTLKNDIRTFYINSNELSSDTKLSVIYNPKINNSEYTIDAFGKINNKNGKPIPYELLLTHYTKNVELPKELTPFIPPIM